MRTLTAIAAAALLCACASRPEPGSIEDLRNKCRDTEIRVCYRTAAENEMSGRKIVWLDGQGYPFPYCLNRAYAVCR